ncbi:MAG: helix-turn-helix domain-containing protein [Gemmatimonadota bacterium]
MDLSDILKRPEGKTLEFKRDASSPKPLLRTVVAFANSAGGHLVIGANDADRAVVGVSEPRLLEERVANLIADAIEPRLLAEIEVVPWRDRHLVVVEVHPSALRPHHLRAEGAAGGTYVRLGSTNRKADAALASELGRRTVLASYDEQPVPDLSYEAVDFAAFSQSFADAERPVRREHLRSLGLIAKHERRMVPTIGGVILYGVDRLDRFPDAWIQVGRFAGSDRSEIVDRAELRGLPVIALDQALTFVERNTRRGAEIGRLVRRDRIEVPPVALREALVNAVVHADYAQRGAPIRVAVFDDRVEVENPGILLPGLTVEDLREGVSRLRNRVIGRVFSELGLAEQWGSGIQRMTSACASAGLPAPEFTEVGLRFRVTIRTIPVATPSRDDLDQMIVDYVADPKGRSTAEIAVHIGLTTRATQHRLGRLKENGVVVAIGSGPRDPRRRWHATR